MVDLYIAQYNNVGQNHSNVFHLAVCRECKISWRIDNYLDNALKDIANHYCPHTIISGPNPVIINMQPSAKFVQTK